MKEKIILVVEVKENGYVLCDKVLFKPNTNIAKFIREKVKQQKEKSNG